jgi:4-hydroxybenzoate polyprenyltransferase
MSKVRTYLSLVKFSHTIFAMPFAFIGFFLAIKSIGVLDNVPDRFQLNRGDLFLKFLLVIFCMVFARSAAMAFNRYLDRNFDAKNPRTAIREIPAGILAASNVLLFTIVNCVLFIVCCFFINTTCLLLSPVALVVVLGYSYTKRFTPLCHLILGVGLSLAPMGAWLAVTGHFSLLPLLFSFVVITWVSGFDIIYALQDDEFDRGEKLYSIPASFGRTKALRISESLHLLSMIFVALAGLYGAFNWIYWVGAVFFMSMLIYQHRLVNPDDLKKVNPAFMKTNGIASFVFAIFVIGSLFY